MPERRTAIVWFRDDLRVSDNPALAHAVDEGYAVVPLFVLDETAPHMRELGGAMRWFAHHALAALQGELAKRGAKLVLREGDSRHVLDEIIEETDASAVFWNRRYEPGARELDASIKADLKERELEVHSFAGTLIHEPARVKTKTGGFYKVYTPFSRAFLAEVEVRDPIDAPERIEPAGGNLASLSVDELKLLPTAPDWSGGFSEWEPGEDGAGKRVKAFMTANLDGYDTKRDDPAGDMTSKFSPHLRWGDLSPFQVWAAIDEHEGNAPADDVLSFRKEIIWREFNHHLLFHFGDLANDNWNPKFDVFPWRYDEEELRAWQKGRTGYPIVDAGMRQLWQTGWMHNRVRMICGSFLVKHLLHDWREGERWFWDCLVDGDVANNPANWQWVAGTGADAPPYFRIFNPMTQGAKFDPDGDYVRTWVPELADVPAEHIHEPWDAPKDVLEKAGVRLGETYPKPIVDHKAARQRALDALAQMKEAAEREAAE